MTPTTPTRVCPHCHAQSETTAARCPHCRKKFKKRSTFATVAIVLVILGALGIGGCALLVGGAAVAVDEAVKEQEAKGITKAQYEGVAKGSTRAMVESKLGKPQDVQEMEIDQAELAKITGGPSTSTHDCIYYQRKGELASMFQFCFDNGKMSSKSAY
jgi:hypothetical protein